VQIQANRLYGTVDEFLAFVRTHIPNELRPFALEWAHAAASGWDRVEFDRLYQEYVWSTQIELKQDDDPTELKGRPLENLVCYFLEKGAVATGMRPISDPGKWQVDGQGPINMTAIVLAWGEPIAKKLGFQLYMEAKNHIDPATREEFATHYQRMMDHDCQLGVFVSTSGFRVGRGLGIAESVRENYLRGNFHLLLAFPFLQRVITQEHPPLVILKEVLAFAANNSYVHDTNVQKLYSPEYCHKLAAEEYTRLFGKKQVIELDADGTQPKQS
jgi:hypothetical protein